MNIVGIELCLSDVTVSETTGVGVKNALTAVLSQWDDCYTNIYSVSESIISFFILLLLLKSD